MADYPEYLRDAVATLIINKAFILVKDGQPCIENASDLADTILAAICKQYNVSPKLPPMEQNNG